jgi:16S rRNA (guanine(1405)-N(7))-methyltransferase
MNTSPERAALLEELVAAVLKSAKYSNLSQELIRDIGARELANRRNLDEAIKATKRKLHQIGGAYTVGSRDYARWLSELRIAVKSGQRSDLLTCCKQIMGYHASTKERLPILERFYAETLADIPPPRTVLDLACGLNPLALPWMPLAERAEYYAYDIYQDMAEFLNEFLALMHTEGRAEARDVLRHAPEQPADLALLLKAIPCLEQIDAPAVSRLLEYVNARHMLISFPVHSLGGRSKGMSLNYEARFGELVAGKPWQIKRFAFATELAFLISR